MEGPSHKEQEQSAATATSSETLPTIAINGPTTAQIIAPVVIRGDNANVNINSPPPSTPSQERIEFNIQESISTFTAREDFLKDIHQDIFHNQKTTAKLVRSRLLVICGMAGVGKTQTVRKYIELNKISYDHVLWINAQSYDEAIHCFLRLARRISTDDNFKGKPKNEEDILAEIYDYVCRKFALIVYDNVDSYESDDDKSELKLLLPQAITTGWKVPAIIVTTRYRDWPNFTIRELKGFDLSESLHFLSVLQIEDSEDNRNLLEEVANMCEGLPLALQHAISFFRIKNDNRAALNDDPYTLKEFLTDSNQRKEFISAKPTSESEYPGVHAIFEMTFEQIGLMKYGELAIQCMDVMAILNPDCIPTILIKQFFSPANNKVAEALTLLHKYTLVTRCDTYYQIHRMVQTAKIETSKKNGSSYVKQNFNTILESLTQFLNTLPTNSENVQEILNNSKRLHDQAEELHSEQLLEFQDILVRHLENVGSYRTAIELQRKNYQSKEKLWGPEHPKTIKSKFRLSFILQWQGHNDEAEELYNDILKMRIKVLGADHPDTLITKNNLATVYNAQGKYDKAEELYNDFLKMQINVLGADHPDTLTTKNNLGLVYSEQGKYDKAEELYNHVLKMRIKVLGADHPNTLITKNNLGLVYSEQGKYDKAEELYNDFLKIQINVLGADHPDTLTTKNSLGLVYYRQGKYDKAEELYTDFLKMRINILGPDHPHIHTTKSNLAAVYNAQGKYDKAEELYTNFLKMEINLLGHDHPGTLTTKNNLAVVYSKQGKNDKAEELYNDVLKMRINVLGVDHPDTLTTKSNLGLVYHGQGKYDKAEELYNDVLNMQINVLGAGHPVTLNTKNNLGLVYHGQGKYDKAEELFNDVLKMRINELGADHPGTLTTKNNLGVIYNAQGKYDKAEELYNDVLKMQINVLGADHPSTLNTKNNLAEVLSAQSKYDKAEELYNDVLKMRINVLGADHPDTLVAKNKLAVVYSKQGKYMTGQTNFTTTF